MPSNSHYLSRITPQHRKRKFMRWLAALLTPHLDAEILLRGMDDAFDLDKARGVQLDVLGQIVGRNRLLSFDPADGSSPLLDDDTYELVIRAKISTNQWDGTIPGILELWDNLFPGYKLYIMDNQDMTMDQYVIGLTTPLEAELVMRGYITPKPMGVRINYNFASEHPGMSTTVGIGGIAFPSITLTELPPYRPEMVFKGTPRIGGIAFPAITETSLPPYRPPRNFNTEIKTGGSTWSISQTSLPPIAKGD